MKHFFADTRAIGICEIFIKLMLIQTLYRDSLEYFCDQNDFLTRKQFCSYNIFQECCRI